MELKIKILAALLLLVFPIIIFAQEEITITTYYPSPFGSYDALEANRFQADRVAIGDGNDPAVIGDGVLDFVPLAVAPAGNQGSIYYDIPQNMFLYHDGAAWRSFTQSARLVFYAPGPPVDCQPVGTHVVAVLDAAMRGVNMNPPPSTGYMVCH